MGYYPERTSETCRRFQDARAQAGFTDNDIARYRYQAVVAARIYLSEKRDGPRANYEPWLSAHRQWKVRNRSEALRKIAYYKFARANALSARNPNASKESLIRLLNAEADARRATEYYGPNFFADKWQASKAKLEAAKAEIVRNYPEYAAKQNALRARLNERGFECDRRPLPYPMLEGAAA